MGHPLATSYRRREEVFTRQIAAAVGRGESAWSMHIAKCHRINRSATSFSVIEKPPAERRVAVTKPARLYF